MSASSSCVLACNCCILTSSSLAGLWGESRRIEAENHDALIDLQAQRSDEGEAVRARVDERNKAIDVMVKATFMVCQRFNRYKDTPQVSESAVTQQ